MAGGWEAGGRARQNRRARLTDAFSQGDGKVRTQKIQGRGAGVGRYIPFMSLAIIS